MTVYVDLPIYTRSTSKKPRKKYAHMVADTFAELHAFAEKIGVKKHFFHRSRTAHHYDINSDQWEIATKAGAAIISSTDIVKIGKVQV